MVGGIFVSKDTNAAKLHVTRHLSGERSVRLMVLGSSIEGSVGTHGGTLGRTSVTFLYLPSTTTVRTMSLLRGSGAIVVSASATRHAGSDFTCNFPRLSGSFRRGVGDSGHVTIPNYRTDKAVTLVCPLVRGNVLSGGTLLSMASLANCDNNKGSVVTSCRTSRESGLLSTPHVCNVTRGRGRLPRVMGIYNLLGTPTFVPVMSSFCDNVRIMVPLFGSRVGNAIRSVGTVCGRGCGNPVMGCGRSFSRGNFISSGGLSFGSNVRVSISNGSSEVLLVTHCSGLKGNTSNTTVRYVGLGLNASGASNLSL